MRTILVMLAACMVGYGCAASPRGTAMQPILIGAQERAAIERTIRAALTLPADAPLVPADFALITELDLSGAPITDTGAAWLADPATGLTALNISSTTVTDAGLKDLTRSQTGLSALTALDIGATQVTDAGLRDLAREGTALKNLTTLYIYNTPMTDVGLRHIANSGTGLTAMTSLMIWNTQVTDAGFQDMIRTGTGLKALSSLHLRGTPVTAAEAAAAKAVWPGITIHREPAVVGRAVGLQRPHAATVAVVILGDGPSRRAC